MHNALVVEWLPQPPAACALADGVLEQLQAATGRQFDMVVVGLTAAPTAVTPPVCCTDFLACQSLLGMHVLLMLPPLDAARAVQHFLRLCHEGKGPLSTALLRDPQSNAVVTDLLHGVPLRPLVPDVGQLLSPASPAWLNADGSVQPLPSHAALANVPTPRVELQLAGMDFGDILTVRAGIHSSSVRMLLDTGASKNFISAQLAAALDLPVYPDRQNISLVLADGTTAPITGSVSVPVCIGRFRARVQFLVTALNPGFDAVLGYEWLRTHCDLYLTKSLLAFKCGSKVTVHRIPRRAQMGPAHRWSTGSSLVEHGVRPQQLRRTAGAPPPNQAGGSPAGIPLLNAVQLKRVLREKEVHAVCCYLSLADTVAAVRATGDPADPAVAEALVEKLLADFPDVFAPPTGLPPMRNVAHAIPLEPGARPPFRRGFRLSAAEMAELRKQLTDMLMQGIVVPSVSPYGAPVLFVRKKDGSLRMCVDYRALNKVTIRNRFPLPRIDDLLDKIKGATCFTSLDLASGYHQVRLQESDCEKTAFSTPLGHFEFKVLPFGLCNAPSVFAAVMGDIFKDLPFVLLYLDDALILSDSVEQHDRHVRIVLERLRQHSLKVKLSKCEFFRSSLKFLGHIVSARGVQLDPDKVAVVQEWPVPRTATQVRQFLGLTNYFRKFIQGYGSLAKPLTLLTGGKQWQWGPEQQVAFDGLKVALTSAPTLASPDMARPFTVITDASDIGIGAVLMQNEHPCAYMSKAFTDSEKNWTVTDRELFAVITALREWRCYLIDKPFLVVTDHNPLTYFSTKRDLSPRQIRWAELLANYSFEWEYRPGRSNVADPLSRNPAFLAYCLAAVQTRRQRAAAGRGGAAAAAPRPLPPPPPLPTPLPPHPADHAYR